MKRAVVIIVIILGFIAIYFENTPKTEYSLIISFVAELLIVILATSRLIFLVMHAKYKRIYLTKDLIPTILLAVYIFFFFMEWIFIINGKDPVFTGFPLIIIFRNMLILSGVFNPFQKFSSFIHNMAVNPAKTILISFLIVIAFGTILLSMPFTAISENPLSFFDSLFTATSAVCVTGLMVVDMSYFFSFWGKLVILILMQIGGLGIMILSFSTIFMFRRSVSLENRIVASYLVNNNDMAKITSTTRKIIIITFCLEAAGAVFLFAFIEGRVPVSEKIFYAIFHSVSAFCNAGFSLFTGSLEQFESNFGFLLIISLLVILGAISFSAMMDVGSYLFNRIKSFFTKKYKKNSITLNTYLVLTYTAILIFSGMFLFYFLEHGNSMRFDPISVQYLSSFFQSVSLRTAGFDTIPVSDLLPSTVSIMIIFMFIGGASGGTAGGIKVNTLATIFAYLRSYFKKQDSVTLYNRFIPNTIILKAFTIFVLGIMLVGAGFTLLLFFEKQPPLALLFETVGAFSTTGMTMGITPFLSTPGRIVLTLLMFAGRIGPLTIVASIKIDKNNRHLVKYPDAEIAIG